MSSDAIAAFGAFLSGAGAILGALYGYRRLIDRMHQECEDRMAALREGIKIGRGGK